MPALLSNPVARSMLRSGLLLALFALVGGGLVAWVFQSTAERIALNEREALLQDLNALVPHAEHDNDMVKDTIEVIDPDLLGTGKPVTVYRARKAGAPVAAVLTPVAPDGYGGAIALLVAVRADATLAGVRVLSHKETPGLGDLIETTKSDWILRFTGLSLGNPPLDHWAVRRDGGDFDQFTGATITPRAVVKAVRNALQYFDEKHELLLAPALPDSTQESAEVSEGGASPKASGPPEAQPERGAEHE